MGEGVGACNWDPDEDLSVPIEMGGLVARVLRGPTEPSRISCATGAAQEALCNEGIALIIALTLQTVSGANHTSKADNMSCTWQYLCLVSVLSPDRPKNFWLTSTRQTRLATHCRPEKGTPRQSVALTRHWRQDSCHMQG